MSNDIKSIIHKIKKFSLDILSPRKCAGCGKRDESFCDACLKQSFKYGAGCVFCNFRNNTGKICRTCQIKYEAPVFQILWTSEYKPPVKNAIKELKYRKRLELAQSLAVALHKKFLEYHPKYEKGDFLIIPVPMHPAKEYSRGFNQATLLAREFSKISNIAVNENVLQKSIDTKTQVETKKKEERIKNLENAFEVNSKELMAYGVRRKAIILIDDVATTGATFMHASRALKKALRPNSGQADIKIICLAIAHGY